ncbi:pentapeptide repeat-containing protein [Sorangium sp. So ce118]
MLTLRLAAAQLDYHAAFEAGGLQATREPTGALEGRVLSGVRVGDDRLDRTLRSLRERIERAYLDAFQPRLEAVIRFCRELDVDLLVLPEYAVPLALLPAVALAAGPRLTVVAGTHTVTFEGWRRSGVYERLGLTDSHRKPVIGSAVAPVIQGGRALALQPKLSASRAEPDLVAGREWALVPVQGVHLGVLIGLDFLKARDSDVAPLVTPGLDVASALAVPVFSAFATPEHMDRSLEEFSHTHGRPIAWASHAHDGGTRIYTPEGPPTAILAVGRPPALAPGVEGVVVADVRPGDARQRFRQAGPTRPVAAAVLMDVRRWAALSEVARAVQASKDVLEAFSRVEEARRVLQRAAESDALPEIARARWAYLAEGAEGTQRLEHLHALTRDIWVDGVVDHRSLQRGLVEGAICVLREVERQRGGAPAVASVRAWLEQESSGRLRDAAIAFSVVKQVTAGLVPELELLPPPDPGADGSFVRWTADASDLRARLTRARIRVLAGDELAPALAGRRAHPGGPSASSGGVKEQRRRGPRHREPLHRAAALLALRGFPPAFLVMHDPVDPGLMLASGLAVFYCAAVPAEASLERLADARATLATAAGLTGPAAAHSADVPLVLTDAEADSLPPGVCSIPAEIRALGVHEAHLRALASFLATAECARFVEPEARLRGEGIDDAMEHLKAWLDGPHSLCLMLGESGIGKTTMARAFAASIASKTMEGKARGVVFIDLSAWRASVDLAGMVRHTLGVEEIAGTRFAIEEGACTLILDGFDELSSRLPPADVGAALQQLLAWRTPASKVVLTSRPRLFLDAEDVERTFSQSLHRPVETARLGTLYGVTMVELLPFDEARIRYYLERAAFDAVDAARAWEVINEIRGLRELAQRPLTLDMIRWSLVVLVGMERVSLVELHETYVGWWATLPGNHERLSPEEKLEIAEAIALCIWRGGDGVIGDRVRASALLDETGAALSEPLRRKLSSDDAARQEVQAGAFVVFGEDGDGGAYRLAHRSFVEHLVARRTVRRLAQGDRSALDLPRFSAEVIAHARALAAWQEGRGEIEAVLTGGYQPRLSENALLLAHAEGFSSSKERPYRLEGARLAGVDLRKARLAGAWLAGADLTGARLTDVWAVGARLDGAVLDGADLSSAALRDAELRGVRARGAKLDWTRCEGADLRDAELDGSTAFLAPPKLWDARLDGASVVGTAWRNPPRGVELRRLVGAADARWRSDEPLVESLDAGGASCIEAAWHPTGVAAVAFSPDGMRLATACCDGIARVWESRMGRLLLWLEGHRGPINDLAYSPDGARLVTVSDDKDVRIWETRTGRLVLVAAGHKGAVTGVEFSPDGERFATSSEDGTARLWEAATGRLLRTLTKDGSAVTGIAFSADYSSLFMASAGDDQIHSRHVSTGETLGWIMGRWRGVRAMAASIDAKSLAIACSDHATWIEGIGTEQCVVLTGHEAPITAVAFSPGGERVATASSDRTARLWETATGRQLARINAHSDRVNDIAFSRDGERLVTASSDTAVRVWDARTGRLLLALPGVVGQLSGEQARPGAREWSTAVRDAATGRVLDSLAHLPEGGVAVAGAFAAPSYSADLDSFVVRTGARCAPLMLYRDVCVSLALITDALCGKPVPAVSIPMDIAAQRAAVDVEPAHQLLVPTGLTGATLLAALADFAARRDLRLAEQTLARCDVRVEGTLRAGSPGALRLWWTLPAGLELAPGFRRSAAVLLAGETVQRPLELGAGDRVVIPASASGRVALSITFFLDGAEITRELSLTAFARNPYIVGSPIVDPADFYGRIGVVDQILAAIEDDSVAVRGEIRIGKTSLLHQLARSESASASVEMVSLQPYAGRFARFLPELTKRLAPDQDAAAPGDEYQQLDAAVTRRLEAAASRGRRARLVLLLDEVQFLAHAWELRHQLRGLLQARKGDGLRAVVAGPGSGLRALAADPDASAFLNMFQPFYLGPMTPAEMRRLICAPLGPDVVIADEAVDKVISISDGRPLIAQVLCRHALDRLRREEGSRIDAESVERVFHEIAFHDIVHNFYAYPARWAALPESTRSILRRVAAMPEEERATIDRATLRLLAQHDLADVHQRRLDVERTFLMWIHEEAS